MRFLLARVYVWLVWCAKGGLSLGVALRCILVSGGVLFLLLLGEWLYVCVRLWVCFEFGVLCCFGCWCFT